MKKEIIRILRKCKQLKVICFGKKLLTQLLWAGYELTDREMRRFISENMPNVVTSPEFGYKLMTRRAEYLKAYNYYRGLGLKILSRAKRCRDYYEGIKQRKLKI